MAAENVNSPLGSANTNTTDPNTNTTVLHYSEYLQLDKILSAQRLISESYGDTRHEEMLFIIIHQIYELWFKMILYDINSVCEIFHVDAVNERMQLKVCTTHCC